MLVAGVKPGDEVIVPSFTFHATEEVVLLAGGEPVFADVDPDTYTVTAETVEAVITRNTKVIMPVHLYGLPADLDPLKKLARERGLTLVEDAAQAHGAVYKDSRIGSVGDMTCFSFYTGKNMTTGEGGMVTTNDDDSSERVRMLRSHGEQRPYWPTTVGNNYRMTEILAGCRKRATSQASLILRKETKERSVLGREGRRLREGGSTEGASR